MSRDIKFRAWDKKRGEWYGESNPSRLKFYGFHLFGECTLICPPACQDLADIVVMQFTGLYDKNGREIYEGDVVDAVEFKPSVVNFESGTFRFWDLDAKDAEAFEWEVIGNIYETPELLK